jgi:hypothetical protein
MSSSRRGVALTPMETRRDVIVRAAVLADKLGYETFSVPEAWGPQAVGLYLSGPVFARFLPFLHTISTPSPRESRRRV